MTTVKDILTKAGLLGACQQSGKATDWKSLVWLFFSPQGREFCKEHNYPTLEMFRQMKDNVRPYGVHVEEDVKLRNEDAAIIAGNAELEYSGVDKAYKVILMHGAKARIKLSRYAVVRIENIGGSYELENDGTGKPLT